VNHSNGMLLKTKSKALSLDPSMCVGQTAECLLSESESVDTQSEVENAHWPLWSSAAERKINSSIPF